VFSETRRPFAQPPLSRTLFSTSLFPTFGAGVSPTCRRERAFRGLRAATSLLGWVRLLDITTWLTESRGCDYWNMLRVHYKRAKRHCCDKLSNFTCWLTCLYLYALPRLAQVPRWTPSRFSFGGTVWSDRLGLWVFIIHLRACYASSCVFNTGEQGLGKSTQCACVLDLAPEDAPER